MRHKRLNSLDSETKSMTGDEHKYIKGIDRHLLMKNSYSLSDQLMNYQMHPHFNPKQFRASNTGKLSISALLQE